MTLGGFNDIDPEKIIIFISLAASVAVAIIYLILR